MKFGTLFGLGFLLVFQHGAGVCRAQVTTQGGLEFRGSTFTHHHAFKLDRVHYLGEGSRIQVSQNEKGKGSLKVQPGTVMEDLLIIAGPETEVVIEGALLRRCQLLGHAKSRMVITDCVLDLCEINGSGDPEVGFPAIEITDSALHQCSWLKPLNWQGLTMKRCTIQNMRNPAALMRTVAGFGSQPKDLAQAPNVVHSRFVSCLVPPTLLFTVADCLFEGCEMHPLPGAVEAPPPAVDTDVPIRLVWRQGKPEIPVLPPDSGTRLLPPEQDISPGAALALEIQEGLATSPGLALTDNVVRFREYMLGDRSGPPTSMAGNGSPGGAGSSSGADKMLAIQSNQTQVKGLLIQQLASGQEAGTANRLTLTVVPGYGRLKFTQSVGETMTTALEAVERFIQARHGRLPINNDLVISFEDKYSGKDGPSAAVACALLVEAVVTGKAWDPAFAVTGDMNEDGSVQPIGGVAAKVRGAANGGAQIVAIPTKNEGALIDTLLMDGPNALCRAAVFRIATFEEAATLASTERPPALQQAIDEFRVVSEVLQRDPRAQTAILRTPQAVARLTAILEKAPNCLSARYLLAYAQGRLPAALSLSGSIEQTDVSGMAILQAIQKDLNASSSLRPDDVGGAINRLRNLRPRTDRRVWAYLDALVSYGEILRGAIVNPIRSGARAQEVSQRIDSAVDRINTSKQALFADPQVIEELGL